MTYPSGWDPSWEVNWSQDKPAPTNKAYREWILGNDLLNDSTVYIPLSPIGYSANAPWYDRVMQHNIEYLYANLGTGSGGGGGTAPPPYDDTQIKADIAQNTADIGIHDVAIGEQRTAIADHDTDIETEHAKNEEQDDRLDALEAVPPGGGSYDDQWIKDELDALNESVSEVARSSHTRLYDVVGGTGTDVGPGEIWLGPNGDTAWKDATEMRIHPIAKNSEFVVELLGPGDFVHVEYTDTQLAVETHSATFVVIDSPKLDVGTGTYYQFTIELIHASEGDPNLANHVGHEVAFSWTLAPALKNNWLENAAVTWKYGDFQALQLGEFGLGPYGATTWSAVTHVAIHDDALNGVRHSVSQIATTAGKPIKTTIAIETTTIKGDQSVFFAQVTEIKAYADAWGQAAPVTQYKIEDAIWDDAHFPVAGDKLHIHVAGLI